jgi:PIN domain nuclease of toxin-antitoxin system
MTVLLDTHTFLWWVGDDPRLPESVRKVILDTANTVYLSAASGWEIAIKSQLGKLRLPSPPDRVIAELLGADAILGLPVSLSHALHVLSLPLLHRDPFDRLIVAQSQLERLPIVTSDAQMRQYAVEVIW